MSVPDEDAAAFSNLTGRNKKLWSGWSMEFEAIAEDELHSLEKKLTRAASAMGVSYATARRIWDRCLAQGWKGAVDERSQIKAEDSSVPPAFWEHWKKTCEDSSRSCRTEYRREVSLYKAGKTPPGYDFYPPSSIKTGLPVGWDLSTFMRHAPTRYELKAIRIGRAGAANLRPLMLTSRVGLKVGQVYMFDDMWHNTKCNFVGVANEGIRPLELCCLDVASACKILFKLRPRLPRDDGSHRQLIEKDMRFLVVAVLYLFGYRADGTFLTVEHGTAAIREEGPYKEFAHLLQMVTGGAVKIVRGGITDAPTVMGGWPGPKRGNPRLKAALESIHKLFQDSMGLLPGQTGSNNRLDKPERLAGMDAYNKRLLREVGNLSPARIAEMVDLLRFPFPHWHDYTEIYDDVVNWTNDRRLHNLEGWEKNHWTTREYRLDPKSPLFLPMANIAALPPPQQDAVLGLIELPGYTQIRKLSPLEVATAGRRELERLRPEHVVTLLGPDLAVKKSLDEDYCFTLRGHDYGLTDPIKYPAARVRNALNQDVVLDPKAEYLVYPNPFDLDHLVVADMDLRYIGICNRQVQPSRADLAEIHRAIGRAAHDEAALNAPLRARHQADATERQAMLDNNAEVLANAGAIDVGAETTPEPKPAAGDRARDYLLQTAANAGREARTARAGGDA